MLNFIIIFSICSLINVMLNTAKTIIMYNNNKLSSSLINALTYGFYTVVVVLMAGDMDLWIKVVITALTNFVGVWLSMIILDKLRKDKLWKVEATVKAWAYNELTLALRNSEIAFNAVKTDDEKYYVFNIYCNTQKESIAVKDYLIRFNAKYFVSESKNL